MDRNRLIASLQNALQDDRFALDSRYAEAFNAALDRGVQEKFLSVQERSNFSGQLNQRRQKLFAEPLLDNNGKSVTKNVTLYNGKSAVKPMTIKDLLEYDKDEQGRSIAGKYRIPEGMITPVYPNGQVGKVTQQNVGTTLGKQANLAKQIASEQQAATELERTQGQSSLTPGTYAAMAGGAVLGAARGVTSDAEAAYRVRVGGEDKSKVFQDVYGAPTASPSLDPFAFGQQSSKYFGQKFERGVLPAVGGMFAGGLAAPISGPLALPAAFAASIAGSHFSNEAQKALFNALMGDTGKQKIDQMGQPMVDPVTGKPIYENSFDETAGMMAEQGKGAQVASFVADLLPNLIAGSPKVPALLNLRKIGEVASLANAAKQGSTEAIAKLEAMGVTDAAARMAEQLAPKLKANGLLAKIFREGEVKPPTPFRNATQFLLDSSGITANVGMRTTQMKNIAAALRAHPELSQFTNELTESVAETGMEIQQAVQQRMQTDEYNRQARAKGLPEIEQNSFIQDLASVLGGISFEGENRIGHRAFQIGANISDRGLRGLGYDTNPITRQIASEIKGTGETLTKTSTLAPDEHIVGMGNGEFAIVNSRTKTSRIVPAEEIDPALFGMRQGGTPTEGQGARMAGAADLLVPKAGFGKVAEFKPSGENKEIVLGPTHDGFVIRRHLDGSNKADVRVVSIDQLTPENQAIAKKVFDAAGMKPSETKGYVESNAYTNEHHIGLMERQLQGHNAKAFNEAFPAVIALDNNISVYGRIVKLVGKNHAAVQIPTQGRGTDMVVVPLQNIIEGTHQAKAPIEDSEVDAISAQSAIGRDETTHNPVTTETNRVTSASLDGGKHPVMLTPEQMSEAEKDRNALRTLHETNLANGMAKDVASKKRGNAVKSKLNKVVKGIATGSEAYPVGSYIEHTDASGATVGAVVVGNSEHGPIVRPLNNGAPYIAQHTTITSGEPMRPEVSESITEETTPEEPVVDEGIPDETPATGEPAPKPKRKKFAEGVEVKPTAEGTPEEEIIQTSKPTDTKAAEKVAGASKAVLDGSMTFTEKEGKSIAVINTVLQGKAITDLVAQKPRTKQELEDALTNFLVGTDYNGGKMTATEARTAAKGIAEFYDRMIFAQANRILQMTQDKIAGHKTSRVANPSNAKTKEAREKNDYREHHELDIPLLHGAADMLDKAAQELSGQKLSWAELSKQPANTDEYAVAVKAVAQVRDQLVKNYYESSVPAIGKLTKIPQLNKDFEGVFTSIQSSGKIAGQILIGFADRNVSTVIHEIGHALFDGMPADMQIDALKHLGMTPRRPTALNPSIIPFEAHEKFATSLEATFLNAEHDVLGIKLSGNRVDAVKYLDGIFDTIAPFMRSVHGVVYGETEKPAVSLTWRLPYKGYESSLFLWDNMPLICKIDGKEVRCKIPYVHWKKWTGPGILPTGSKQRFSVEIVEFDHPERGQLKVITNDQIEAIGGLTNGFNKRMASALTYWISERANRANAERQYVGLTAYGTSPAAISAAKAKAKGAKVVTASTTPVPTSTESVDSTPETEGETGETTPTPTPTPQPTAVNIPDGAVPGTKPGSYVMLPAPQQADRTTYVARVLPEIMRSSGTDKLDVAQVTNVLGSIYDVNKQNSSIARDKWLDYAQVGGNKSVGGNQVIDLVRTKDGVQFRVNMVTGKVAEKKLGATAWTEIPVEQTFARPATNGPQPIQVQAGVDAVWAAAGAPESLKPRVKSFLTYIAQMHGQNSGLFMPEWLPVKRSEDIATTIDEANEWLNASHDVAGNTVTFETIPTVRGDVKVLEYNDRMIVVANVNGVKIPFYISTGKAGKVKVQPGRWYNIFGVGKDGWINKGTSDQIVNHYGSETLKAVANYLDYSLGDLRGVAVKSVPMEEGSPEFEFINDGMVASTHDDSGNPSYNDKIAEVVKRVDTGQVVKTAKKQATKEKQKKKPSPLDKSKPADSKQLINMGMKDFAQSDLDAVGATLRPDQYEIVNDPSTPVDVKQAIMQGAYAAKVADSILAKSTDPEIRAGAKNSNGRQARVKMATYINEVIARSRDQIRMAEAVDKDGNIIALQRFKKNSDPTEAMPVVGIFDSQEGFQYNVNLATGDITTIGQDGQVHKFHNPVLENANDSFEWLNAAGRTVVSSQHTNINGQGNTIAKYNGIDPLVMPKVYSGILHVARMLTAVPSNGELVAPPPPPRVLWKINGTRAFNETNTRPLYKLRQQDRNAAVGSPILDAAVKHVPESTAKAIASQDHDNHSMQLIDRSSIMRVKAEDEPTSAQEFRAAVINKQVESIQADTDKILATLRQMMRKRNSPVKEGAKPFVYRIIEPSPYIDEATGAFAIAYEKDENGDFLEDENGDRIPILDKEGVPVQDLRPIEKFVMSYQKMPVPEGAKATVDLSDLTVYSQDGEVITDTRPYSKAERVNVSGNRYVFYDVIEPNADGNGSTDAAKDKAINFIIDSYKTLAARMLQKYTPIVKWDNNPLAGMQVWSRSMPTIDVKTPVMNGVPIASIVITAAKQAYNIDAVGATNRWQSNEVTRLSTSTSPVSDESLIDAVKSNDKHYFAIEKQGNRFIYKLAVTHIENKQVGVFTSESSYATAEEAVAAVKEEYRILRGQAYDIWHKIGAEKIANDVIRLAELSRKDITSEMTPEERSEILNAQVIMRQYDWYRGVSKKIMRRYGSAGLAMADLIGGTSPQTPVDANWTNAVQALQMMNRSATYERIVRKLSGDKAYYKVPFNNERSVQVYSIWRAIKNRANYFRGANVDGSNTTPKQQTEQFEARNGEYSDYVTSKGVNAEKIKSASDAELRRLIGDEVVSKLETKIPEDMKRTMLEGVATSTVASTIWKGSGSDPVASFTGWAVATPDWLPTDYTKVTPSADGNKEEHFTNQTEMMDFTVLPRNVFSGSKFGANTDNVLQGFYNSWLDIEDEGSAPKARNFSLNLVGLSSGATIDVWAARYVRRMYHEWHQGTSGFNQLSDADKTFFARVPPSAEQGVQGGYLGKSAYSVKFNADGEAEYVPAKYQKPNPAEPTTAGEFGTGQAVMGLATQYINEATGGNLGMLPSDLQAIVWFAEKQLWMNNGWTNASGAGGSFEYQFAQDVLRYGKLDRFNVMMSGNGVRHLTPEQKERMMNIMRKTLFTPGETGEGSPVAHLSCLVSNSNGDQLNPGGQTQVDINLVAKRGSTPLKPYDPETDCHAIILNESAEKIRAILSGTHALTLPNNVLSEHGNRRISLATIEDGRVKVIGTGVFDGGMKLGSGEGTTYQMVPSNELTDSRPVITEAGKEIPLKNLPDNYDVNQMVHIKPNMWDTRAKMVNVTTATALYPARQDAGKHRRIRPHQAYNVNELKNASADMLRMTGGLDAVISRAVGEEDGSDNIEFDPSSNLRVGHEIYFKPALADERVDPMVKHMYNERFSNMMRRMESFFADHNAHVQFVVQQDPRNQYSQASLINGNVGILAVWNPETEMRYMDYGAGVPENLLTPQQKANNAKLMDYLSGDVDRIRKHEEEWNKLFTEFWDAESSRPADQTIPIFQNYANHFDVNTIHKEALTSETAPATGIDDQSTAWGLGIREKLRHSIQQLGIVIGDGRVIHEADTRVGAFDEVLAGTRETQLQSANPVRVALYKTKKSEPQEEFHLHCASYAGSRLPGLNGVYDYAMDALIRGNQPEYEKAMSRLSERASDEITRVFENMDGIEVEANRNTGIFYGDVEPSIDATIRIDADKHSIDDVLARAAHMGLMFRQQNVYVTQDAAPHEIPGDIHPTGYTTEYRVKYQLSEPITFAQMKEIQKALDLGGANLSQDGKTLTTFTVTTDGESHEQTTQQWKQGISQLGEILQAQGISATVEQDVCRLWNTGSTEDGAYGRFTPYGDILDNLRRRNPKALVQPVTTRSFNKMAPEIKKDVEFALSMLKGRDIKLPSSMTFERTPLSIESQMAIADNYDLMPMNTVVKGPYHDPMCVKAYQALVRELDKQMKWLNVKIEFMPSYRDENGEMVYEDSYNATSSAVVADIRNNNHLYIYPTTIDTFGPRGMDFTGHPLLEVSPHKTADGKPMVWNDVLRAVHDALAHSIYGGSFGANGEEIAFATHAMLTEDPMAIWALNSETRAQNSWVNYNKNLRGPDGALKPQFPFMKNADKPFAVQKAALMPIQTLYTGIKSIDQRIDKLREDMATNHNGYNGSIPVENIVPVPTTDGLRTEGVTALFKSKVKDPEAIVKPGLYCAGDVDILAENGFSIDNDVLDAVVDWAQDDKNIINTYNISSKAQVESGILTPEQGIAMGIINTYNKAAFRLCDAYIGHIQRGDIPNPAPDKGMDGYKILANGIAMQISSKFEDALGLDVDDTRELKNEVADYLKSTFDEFENIGEWHMQEGYDFTKHFGNRILDPVTGQYRNHHGELVPSEFLKDKFEWDNGKIVMYHATLHGKAIGNTGGLVTGNDLQWNSGSADLGLGGTPERISLTYSRAYAIDVIKMLTNYIRIANSGSVQKRLDKALTDRVDEALNDTTNDPINDRIRFKMTQLAHDYSLANGISYNDAYDELKDLWDVSGSFHQFVGNLKDKKFTQKSGDIKEFNLLAQQMVKFHKMMGDTLKVADEKLSSQKQEMYHEYIKNAHLLMGIPYTLIVGPSLTNLSTIDVDNLKPVVYSYRVDPNMLAEHVPSEEELRTYTTGIMEPTGDIYDATGDKISDVDESYVPSRPLFKWRTPRSGAVPTPAPAPATPAVPAPKSVSDRIWGTYDTFNDFCRLSVGGDASPIMIQNFMLANPIEDPKLFFQQFLIMTKAARPNLGLSWKGKTILNGKMYGREADIALGNELRASAFYDDAKAHGLTLSSFGKDEALKELQKTNPKATLADINELGYNSDVSVSNEIMQHMPGQGMSERFFSMSKDYVKMNKYAQAMQHMIDIGYVQGTPGYESAARDMAALINAVAGDIMFPNKSDADDIFGRIAKRIFFAPRWGVSRFAIDPLGHGILNSFQWGRDLLKKNRLESLYDRDVYTRASHFRMMAKSWGLWSALGILYGLLYKNDAIKTSFSKGGTQIQIGDFKFKPPAGLDKTMAIISSVMGIFDSNDKKSNVEKIQKAADNIKVTLMGQMAPGASALYEIGTGRNLFGEPSREVYTPLQRHWEGVTRPILAKAGLDVPMPKISNMMADKFIYMWAQDMMESYEAMKDRDEPYAGVQSAIMGASAFVGARVRYAPKDMRWKYDAAKARPAPGIEHTIIGAEPYGSGDMGWDKLTR